MIKSSIILLVFIFISHQCDASYRPAIAMVCGKNLMYYNMETNNWTPHQNNTSDCVTDESDIFKYCRNVYPNDNITNILLSKDLIKIDNWCKLGHSKNCKGHSHTVAPYLCINEQFRASSLTVPQGCRFQHKRNKKCYREEDWIELAKVACQNISMNFNGSFNVQKPCSSDYLSAFQAFQFVCCPSVKKEVLLNDASRNLLPGPVILEDKIEVEETSTKQNTLATEIPQYCLLPADTGNCKATIDRWYFNSTINRCKYFQYGGCGGNKNQFLSQKECEISCSSPVKANEEVATTDSNQVDICQLAPQTGVCRGYFPRWYYDSNAGRCKTFVYGGCGGNENSFDSEEDCEARCSASPTTTTTSDEETTIMSELSFIDQTRGILVEEQRLFNEKCEKEKDSLLKILKQMKKSFEEEVKETERKSSNEFETRKTKETLIQKFNEEKKALFEDYQKRMKKLDDLYQIQIDAKVVKIRTKALNELQKQVTNSQDKDEELLKSLKRYFESEKLDHDLVISYYNKIKNEWEDEDSFIETSFEDVSQKINKLQQRLQTIRERIDFKLKELLPSKLRSKIQDVIDEMINNFGSTKLSSLSYKDIDLYTDEETNIFSDDEHNGLVDYSGFEEFLQSEGDEESMLVKDRRSQLNPVGVSDGIEETKPAVVWWLVWVTMFVMVALIVLISARVRYVKRRASILLQKDRAKLDQIFTSEQRQLLQMQQNGFENPTYKFFEKQQPA